MTFTSTAFVCFSFTYEKRWIVPAPNFIMIDERKLVLSPDLQFITPMPLQITK